MNIIFDLCGPLIKIDIERINRDLHQYGLPSLRGYHDLYDAGLIKQYDSGLITPECFADEARRVWGYPMPDSLLWEAWNNVVYDFDPCHVETVRRARARGHRTFLLSNSDVVNAKHFCDYMNERAGFDFAGTCFDRLFFSYALNCRKPDVGTFAKVMQLGGMSGSDTLLIDDSRKNCRGAQEAGMQVRHLEDHEEIEAVVEQLIADGVV